MGSVFMLVVGLCGLGLGQLSARLLVWVLGLLALVFAIAILSYAGEAFEALLYGYHVSLFVGPPFLAGLVLGIALRLAIFRLTSPKDAA